MLEGHQGIVRSVVFSNDGQRVVTASDDATARVWDLQGRELNVLDNHTSSVFSTVFSADGQKVVTASSDNTARVWTTDTLSELLEQSCDQMNVYLINNPEILDDLTACQTSDRLSYAAQTLVREGDRLAQRKATADKAVEKYQLANLWSPGLVPNPTQRARNILAALDAVNSGRDLAQSGNLEAAIKQFQEAVRLDPSRRWISPDAEARRFMARALLGEGRNSAQDGNLDTAVTKFEAAIELVPTLRINPKDEVNHIAASAFVEQGVQLAQEGEILQALTNVERALALSPDLTIEASSWNTLCWFGSIFGYAQQVLNACELAIEPDPTVGSYLDSRGLARVLTGDIQGAIRDFEVFIDWEDDETQVTQRREWINALRAGKAPQEIFTPELLEELKSQ